HEASHLPTSVSVPPRVDSCAGRGAGRPATVVEESLVLELPRPARSAAGRERRRKSFPVAREGACRPARPAGGGGGQWHSQHNERPQGQGIRNLSLCAARGWQV